MDRQQGNRIFFSPRGGAKSCEVPKVFEDADTLGGS